MRDAGAAHDPSADIDFLFGMMLALFFPGAIMSAVALALGIAALVKERRATFVAMCGTVLSSTLVLASAVLGVLWWN